jgi:hypothetical protein
VNFLFLNTFTVPTLGQVAPALGPDAVVEGKKASSKISVNKKRNGALHLEAIPMAIPKSACAAD